MDATSYLLGKKAGGGSGTSDYSALTNKPSINGVTLSGNKTSEDLGIEVPTIPTDLIHYKGHIATADDLPDLGQSSSEVVEPMATFSTAMETKLATKDDTTYNRVIAIRDTSKSYYFGGSDEDSSGYTCWCINTNFPETIDGMYTWSVGNQAIYPLIHINASVNKPVTIRRRSLYAGGQNVICFVNDSNNTPTVATSSYGSAYYAELNVTQPGWFMGHVGAPTHLYSNMQNHYIRFKHPKTLNMYVSQTSSPYYRSETYPDVNSHKRLSNDFIYGLDYKWIKANANETIELFTSGGPQANINDLYTVDDENSMYVCNSNYVWEHWTKGIEQSSYYEAEANNLSATNGTDTTLVTFKLPKGMYLVVGNMLDKEAEATRYFLSISPGVSSVAAYDTSDGWTAGTVMDIITITADDTEVGVHCYFNRNITSKIWAKIRAIKLR